MNIEEYIKQHAFETKLNVDCNHEYIDGVDASFAIDEHVKTCPMGTYKAIAVNLGHTNSKVFDSVWRKECPECLDGVLINPDGSYQRDCPECSGRGWIEPYDLMITFCRRKDKLWNVSLYSTKSDVDCGAIAKSFGGGGHKGAAGFQCKELSFEY